MFCSHKGLLLPLMTALPQYVEYPQVKPFGVILESTERVHSIMERTASSSIVALVSVTARHSVWPVHPRLEDGP